MLIIRLVGLIRPRLLLVVRLIWLIGPLLLVGLLIVRPLWLLRSRLPRLLVVRLIGLIRPRLLLVVGLVRLRHIRLIGPFLLLISRRHGPACWLHWLLINNTRLISWLRIKVALASRSHACWIRARNPAGIRLVWLIGRPLVLVVALRCRRLIRVLETRTIRHRMSRCCDDRTSRQGPDHRLRSTHRRSYRSSAWFRHDLLALLID